jgi:hypothetical protein
MEKQPNSGLCFVCGIENPIGFRLESLDLTMTARGGTCYDGAVY